MKKILLTITVVCCCTGIAIAQDGNKTVKKKVVNPSLLYNPSSVNAARNKEKEAAVKAFESGKLQNTTQEATSKSKATTSQRVDAKNN